MVTDSSYKQLELLFQGKELPALSGGSSNKGSYFNLSDLGLGANAAKYLESGKIPLTPQGARAAVSKAQPWHKQAFNGIVGGVLSGVATAVEDLSYLPQIIAQMTGGETDWESNAIAETMQHLKEGIHENMPIYRSGDNPWDWDGGAFVWDSIKGVLDSAIGFGIPGGIVGKGVGAAGKIGKLAKMSNKLARVNPRLGAMARLYSSNKATQQAAHALTSGIIMNDMEGTMMGVELYDQLIKEGIDPEIAAQEASNFKLRNRAFAITDAIGIHGLFKGVGTTRSLLKPRGFGQALKNTVALSSDNLVLQGAKEALEEIGQNVLQREGEYAAKQQAGVSTDDLTTEKSLMDRWWDFATSAQATYEGLLGFFGGGPQRILSGLAAGQFSKSVRDQHDKNYQSQQELIKETKEQLSNYVNHLSELTELKKEAIRTGDEKVVDLINKTEFANIAVMNFEKGTTEALESSLQDIAEMTAEEAAEKGLDSNYQENALDLIDRLKSLEKTWNKYSGTLNQKELFYNRAQRDLLLEQDSLNDQLITEAEVELRKVLDIKAKRQIINNMPLL